MSISLTPACTRLAAQAAHIALDNYGVRRYTSSRYIVTRQKPNPDPADPLTPAMFQVLLALAGGEMHGYAILKAVEDQTGGEVRLSTGTLYGMIKRLLIDGVIAECRNLPAAKDTDARRRYYALTPQGRQVAIAEAERLRKLVQMAESRSLIKRLNPA